MITTLLIPTLNEIQGMRVIMPRVKPEWVDQIIVVDGGSTDGTLEYARSCGYLVIRQRRPGLRHAYLEAMPHVKGDVIITFSPDDNSAPEVIPALITKMAEGYDMVIASRYLGNAKSEDDDIVTALGNRLFTWTVNLLHGGRYTDAMVIYRAFRTQLIYQLDLHDEESYRLPERLFRTAISWEPLMSVRAAKRGMRIGEVPASEPPRIGGQRKLQILRWGAAYYFQFWRELWRWK